MKISRWARLFFGICLLSGCATGVDSTAPYAALHWTQVGLFGHGVSVEIDAVDDQNVSVLTSYTYVRLTPGAHEIRVHCYNPNYDGRTTVTATVEAGKTYHFEGLFEAGEFKFDLVEEEAGKPTIKGSYTVAGIFRPTKVDMPIYLGK